MDPITRDDIASLGLQTYYRTRLTVEARKMTEPFKVLTPHGPAEGAAGDYLGIDVDGWPYPLKASVMERTYSVDFRDMTSEITTEQLLAEVQARAAAAEAQAGGMGRGVLDGVEDLNAF
jgi:hypothetical protein